MVPISLTNLTSRLGRAINVNNDNTTIEVRKLHTTLSQSSIYIYKRKILYPHMCIIRQKISKLLYDSSINPIAKIPEHV